MPSRRRIATPLVLLVLGLIAVPATTPAHGQDESRPPTSLYDPRLGELRRAAVAWDSRPGPTRKVIDQVALVPDVASFYEAIAAWDEDHWFPILIDDAVLAPKFLRAFKPARIVRYPGRPAPIPPRATWDTASRAVGRAWQSEPQGPHEDAIRELVPVPPPGTSPVLVSNGKGPRGAAVPESIEWTPPGIVVATAATPSLPGAVALAAGRFQPLLRWEPKAPMNRRINEAEALELTLDLETAIGGVINRYSVMGDECDFITLAGEYPVSYQSAAVGLRSGPATFDDLVGRDRESLRRWAYTGRLTGDPTESVYRSMCSLFLQPTSALLFDAYDQADAEFKKYSMQGAAQRFSKDVPPTFVPPSKADLRGWHRVLGRLNTFGLILMNSSGSAGSFNLAGGKPGVVPDIPPSVPSIVVLIHSFSATDPTNPRTIAGSWLAGGAFVYFGAYSEPYLSSFRTQLLVASLLNERIPIGAAVRMGPDENPVFGRPWRLHLIGDPLFRLDPRAARAPRWPDSVSTAHWAPYEETVAPSGPAATDSARLAWAAKTALLVAARGEPISSRPELESTIASIHRDSLPASIRPVLDGLRIDALPLARQHRDALLAGLSDVPPPERTVRLRLAIESERFARLQAAIEAEDTAAAGDHWLAVIRSDAPIEYKDAATRRVGQLADRTGRIVPWKARIQEVLTGRDGEASWKFLRDELTRLEKASSRPAAPARAVGPSIRRGT